MFGSIGFPELILIFIVVLLVFGPNKLPEFAKLLGKTLREFRSTIDKRQVGDRGRNLQGRNGRESQGHRQGRPAKR